MVGKVNSSRDDSSEEAQNAFEIGEGAGRTLFELPGDAFFIIEQRGDIVAANPAASKMYGYTEEELIGLNAAELIHPDYHHLLDELKAGVKSKGSFFAQSADIRKDGSRMDVEVWGSIVDFKEEPHLLVMLRDISKHKLVEEALRASENRLKEAQRIGHMGDWEFDVQTQRIQWSDEVYRLFERDPAVGPPTYEENMAYYFPEDSRKLQEQVQRAADFGEEFDTDYHLKLHSGRHVYHRGTIRVLKDERGGVLKLYGTVQDITERKHTEGNLLTYQGQLRSMTTKLIRTEENERRRIATFLHDQIGQSLAIARMKLDALQKMRVSERTNDKFAEIEKALKQSIADLRSLTFELSPPILYELGLEPALEWLAEKVSEEHGLAIEFEDDGSPKPLDDNLRAHLFRAARELLFNIVKHARTNSGRVRIWSSGNDVYVSVMDDGCGFDTASVSSSGLDSTGFGLFSIRERIEHIGGCALIESKPGRGTSVTLIAPLEPNRETTKENKT